MDEDDDWADFEAAIFHPLDEDDPVLAAHLAARFVERLLVGMSPTEAEYAKGWASPVFEVGVTPKRNNVLRVSFAGGQASSDWDGSAQDAEEIADSSAQVRGDESVWDYWVQGGGWREWNGDREPRP